MKKKHERPVEQVRGSLTPKPLTEPYPDGDRGRGCEPLDSYGSCYAAGNCLDQFVTQFPMVEQVCI